VTGRSVLYKIVVLFLGCARTLFPQQYPDTKVDRLLKIGIESIVDQNYPDAEQKFKQLDESYPELPFGNIYLAAVRIASSVDLGEPYDESYILSHFEKAEKQSEVLLDKNEKDVWGQYCMALTKGYTAYYRALNRDYISAFSNGLSSISHFEKCLQIDSSFYESYIAIGTYKYWKSAKTSFLTWLPFIKDDKQSGLDYLRSVMDKSTYNRHLGYNSLIWVYINEKKYQAALSECEKALKRNPESRFFKWAEARVLQDIDKRRAIDVYKNLLESYTGIKDNNHYNEIVLKHKIAMLYYDLGENKKALKLCSEILAVNPMNEYVKERLDNRIDRVKKLKKELQLL